MRNGHGPIGLFLFRSVGASAVVACAADAVIIITCDGGNAAAANLADDFIGPDILADKVAETEYLVGPAAINIRQAGLESGKIGVDVGEKCDLHEGLFF